MQLLKSLSSVRYQASYPPRIRELVRISHCNVITARAVMNIAWRHISDVMVTLNKQTVARKQVYYRLILVMWQVLHVERNNFMVIA